MRTRLLLAGMWILASGGGLHASPLQADGQRLALVHHGRAPLSAWRSTTGATGSRVGVHGREMPEVDTPEEATARARELLEAGADAVKVYAATWAGIPVVMPQEAVARVAPGLDADLVIVEGDPAADIRVLARVRTAIRGGRLVFEAANESE